MKKRAKKLIKSLIGIDEAGRGPLAGPVVVAGVKFRGERFPRRYKELGALKDSKKLSPQRREEWFKFLADYPKIEWATAVISPKLIDSINIARAANLGAGRVYKRLSGSKFIPAVLDGSLSLPRYIPHQTIIKGDEKFAIIAAASIFAKVKRDRIMRRLHRKYPMYGLDGHKGYGTKKHREAIKKNGLSSVHRRSFRVKV